MAEIREARMEYEADEYVKPAELQGELAKSENTEVPDAVAGDTAL